MAWTGWLFCPQNEIFLQKQTQIKELDQQQQKMISTPSSAWNPTKSKKNSRKSEMNSHNPQE